MTLKLHKIFPNNKGFAKSDFFGGEKKGKKKREIIFYPALQGTFEEITALYRKEACSLTGS